MILAQNWPKTATSSWRAQCWTVIFGKGENFFWCQNFQYYYWHHCRANSSCFMTGKRIPFTIDSPRILLLFSPSVSHIHLLPPDWLLWTNLLLLCWQCPLQLRLQVTISKLSQIYVTSQPHCRLCPFIDHFPASINQVFLLQIFHACFSQWRHNVFLWQLHYSHHITTI